jgi:hypothetical protein
LENKTLKLEKLKFINETAARTTPESLEMAHVEEKKEEVVEKPR